MRRALTQEELAASLPHLDGWTVEPDGRAIAKTFRFQGFVEAFAFMTKVALIAERSNHHPEWCNVYDRVDVRLTTHDVGGVSHDDLAMAVEIERLLST